MGQHCLREQESVRGPNCLCVRVSVRERGCPPPPWHAPRLSLINPVGAPVPYPSSVSVCGVSRAVCGVARAVCGVCGVARVSPVVGVSSASRRRTSFRRACVSLQSVFGGYLWGVSRWVGFRPLTSIYPCVGCLSCLTAVRVSILSVCAPRGPCRATISRVSTTPIAVSIPCDITVKHCYPIPFILFHGLYIRNYTQVFLICHRKVGV